MLYVLGYLFFIAYCSAHGSGFNGLDVSLLTTAVLLAVGLWITLKSDTTNKK